MNGERKKIIKIITAINNEVLNKKLVQENFNVLCKDIQYQEGIFEQIEKSNEIDIIIISSILPGNMRIEKVIEKIIEKIPKIRIIIILEKKNDILEDFLYSKGVYDIYYDNEVDVDTIINLLTKKEIKKEEFNYYEKEKLIKEINELKKIINEKEENKNNINKNIISIYGINGIGKTLLSIIIALNLKINKKIIIISKEYENIKKINNNKINIRKNIEIGNDFNIINKNNNYDYIILDNPEKYNNNYFNILIIGQNLLELRNSKKIKEKNIKIIINKINKYSIYSQIIEEIYNNQKIIGKISFNNLYNKLLNNRFKYKIENNIKIKKEFEKIIKNINNWEE